MVEATLQCKRLFQPLHTGYLIHHSLFYHELPRRLTHRHLILTLAPPGVGRRKHNPIYMGLRIFTPPTSTLYQISNSLKTENSLTVLPRLLSVFRTERRRSSAKKNSLPKSPPSSGQKCQRINVEAGHNTVSHRLSLLFPKLRLSNFMISSLASAVFVQCPPQCAQLSRQTLPASLPPHRASCWQQPRPHRAGRSGEIMPARQSHQACQSESLRLQSSI